MEPLPRLHVAFLCMMDSTHFYTVCSLFSYAGILSSDLGWVSDVNASGFVAGWLQSANVLGRAVTSSMWGLVASHYGARPVLLATLSSLLLGGVLFGFCRDLYGAMVIRFIFFGVLNGWPVLQGPCAAALAGDERQTEVLGLIIAAGSGTQLLGPALGGWTYGLLPDYPAAVPSLLGCLLAMGNLVLFFYLGSTLPEPARSKASADAASVRQAPSFKAVLSSWPMPLLLCMRFGQGFACFAVFEAVPLWLISDPALGGLGMSEKEVGSLLSRSGLWNIVFFSYILPLGSRRLGGRGFSLVMSTVGACTVMLLPFAHSVWVANALHLLCASTIVSQGALNLTFTNNAAGPTSRTVATGVAVTIETVGKASAPIVMSSLFAWSLRTWGLPGHYLVFVLLAALSAFQLACTLCLPNSVECHSHMPLPKDSNEDLNNVEAEVLGVANEEVMHRKHSP